LGRALFKGARVEACQRVLNPGESFMMFSDWRQLPLMSDAVRVGGVVWRGVVAWNKGRAVRTPIQADFKRQ
jgi:site-specific DNA-methyltransferase (adenine-specific)